MKIHKWNPDNTELYTPKSAVDLIKPYINKKMVIWAPFSLNKHHFADYLRSCGYQVINTHIETGQDFFTFKPDFHFDAIVDNPPFKNKTAFLKKVIEYGKPFALLLPLHTFGIKAPVRLFVDAGIEPQLLIPEARINFHNQPKQTIAFKTVYICDRFLPKQIILKKTN